MGDKINYSISIDVYLIEGADTMQAFMNQQKVECLDIEMGIPKNSSGNYYYIGFVNAGNKTNRCCISTERVSSKEEAAAHFLVNTILSKNKGV